MTSVSRETEQRLALYEALLVKWNRKINLVSSSDAANLRSRHISDCLQLTEFCAGARGRWADLGSGGGLPGLVLAIALKSEDLHFTLVESDSRKAAFLRTAAREPDLPNVTVVVDRIEALAPLQADHLSARALAPLSQLLTMADRHLATHGTAWLMKGRNWRRECDEAQDDWRFDLSIFPSRTDTEAAILKISGVSHA